jgi:hypothetical protein
MDGFNFLLISPHLFKPPVDCAGRPLDITIPEFFLNAESGRISTIRRKSGSSATTLRGCDAKKIVREIAVEEKVGSIRVRRNGAVAHSERTTPSSDVTG